MGIEELVQNLRGEADGERIDVPLAENLYQRFHGPYIESVISANRPKEILFNTYGLQKDSMGNYIPDNYGLLSIFALCTLLEKSGCFDDDQSATVYLSSQHLSLDGQRTDSIYQNYMKGINFSNVEIVTLSDSTGKGASDTRSEIINFNKHIKSNSGDGNPRVRYAICADPHSDRVRDLILNNDSVLPLPHVLGALSILATFEPEVLVGIINSEENPKTSTGWFDELEQFVSREQLIWVITLLIGRGRKDGAAFSEITRKLNDWKLKKLALSSFKTK